MHHFPNKKSRHDFAVWLQAELPEENHHQVEDYKELPMVHPGSEDEHEAVFVHACMFSFAADCSQRGPVQLHIANKLLHQFAADGFLTSTEPLVLRCPAAPLH